jgi:transcriptional regulator with XRE-family HTH domain
MLTRYRFVRETIGLSQFEAATLHGVAIDTISKWERGKRDPPAGVIRELQDLQMRLLKATDELCLAIATTWSGDSTKPVPVGIPEDARQAYGHGYPSHQAMMRAIGTAVARLSPDLAVEFVRIGEGAGVTVDLSAKARVR